VSVHSRTYFTSRRGTTGSEHRNGEALATFGKQGEKREWKETFELATSEFRFEWTGAVSVKPRIAETCQGGAMRKMYMLAAAVLMMGMPAAAKEPRAGTIVSETSVGCGSQIKNKKETTELLCQEYVVRTETTEYHIRQEKHAGQELIPVNTSIEFTLDKDKMKFKANGKKYEYQVVSEMAVATAKP
jgi:hypothetical protein